MSVENQEEKNRKWKSEPTRNCNISTEKKTCDKNLFLNGNAKFAVNGAANGSEHKKRFRTTSVSSAASTPPAAAAAETNRTSTRKKKGSSVGAALLRSLSIGMTPSSRAAEAAVSTAEKVGVWDCVEPLRPLLDQFTQSVLHVITTTTYPPVGGLPAVLDQLRAVLGVGAAGVRGAVGRWRHHLLPRLGFVIAQPVAAHPGGVARVKAAVAVWQDVHCALVTLLQPLWQPLPGISVERDLVTVFQCKVLPLLTLPDLPPEVFAHHRIQLTNILLLCARSSWCQADCCSYIEMDKHNVLSKKYDPRGYKSITKLKENKTLLEKSKSASGTLFSNFSLTNRKLFRNISVPTSPPSSIFQIKENRTSESDTWQTNVFKALGVSQGPDFVHQKVAHDAFDHPRLRKTACPAVSTPRSKVKRRERLISVGEQITLDVKPNVVRNIRRRKRLLSLQEQSTPDVNHHALGNTGGRDRFQSLPEESTHEVKSQILRNTNGRNQFLSLAELSTFEGRYTSMKNTGGRERLIGLGGQSTLSLYDQDEEVSVIPIRGALDDTSVCIDMERALRAVVSAEPADASYLLSNLPALLTLHHDKQACPPY